MMAEPVKEPKVRIQLDLTPKQAERFDNLIHYCDLGSRKELFNVAMSLFYWATQEASKGRKIASYDERTDHVETIVVPALDGVEVHVANESASASSSTATDLGSRKADRPHFGLVGQRGEALASSSD
ncbi:hypothetical protein [Roseovarius sp.]|uniref:hypothetical protein n=1 Tax=Roseovarius sp. TaxID=1486281 RepID=UPI003B594257